MAAASSGDIETCRALLRAGASVDATDTEGSTALLIAAYCRHVDVVDVLLAAGADASAARSSDELTALHVATRFGDVALLQLLASAARAVPSDARLLQLAAFHGHLHATAFWLGADAVDVAQEGPLALFSAAANGHEPVVALLLEHGVDADAIEEHGWTPCLAAAASGHEAVVQRLIDAGASLEHIDHAGNTIVHVLAEHNRPELLQSLWPRLEARMPGALAAVNHRGYTPLLEAVACNHMHMVDVLVAVGSSFDALVPQGGWTWLHVAARHGHVELIEHMVREHATASLVDPRKDTSFLWGGSALHVARMHGQLPPTGNTELNAKAHGHDMPIKQVTPSDATRGSRRQSDNTPVVTPPQLDLLGPRFRRSLPQVLPDDNVKLPPKLRDCVSSRSGVRILSARGGDTFSSPRTPRLRPRRSMVLLSKPSDAALASETLSDKPESVHSLPHNMPMSCARVSKSRLVTDAESIEDALSQAQVAVINDLMAMTAVPSTLLAPIVAPVESAPNSSTVPPSPRVASVKPSDAVTPVPAKPKRVIALPKSVRKFEPTPKAPKTNPNTPSVKGVEWAPGQQVLAKAAGKRDFAPGTVQKAVGPGFYMIVFDDASMDHKVPDSNIRDYEVVRDHELTGATSSDFSLTLEAMEEDYRSAQRFPGLPACSESSSVGDDTRLASSTVLDLNATLLEGLKAQIQRLAPPMVDKSTILASDVAVMSTLVTTPSHMSNPADDADTTDVTIQDVFILDISVPAMRAHQLKVLYAQLHRLKTKLNAVNVERQSNASLSGTPVLVFGEPCYFGKVATLLPNGLADVISLDDINGRQQVPLDAIQVLTPAADLKRQHEALSRLADLFYPGARMLVMARRGQLTHATIRRRSTEYEYDIKIDRTSENMARVRAQQLIPIQGLSVPLPQLQRKTLQIKHGAFIFRIHEFVYVLDMDNASKIYMAGVISGINSNRTVVIDYENGDMDGSVSVQLLEKYDTRKDRGRIRPPNCGPVGYINDDIVMALHPMSKAIAKAKITCVHASSCDICFLDGVIVLHMPRSRLNQSCLTVATIPPPVAPRSYVGHFKANQYVLVFSHRFQRYCTAQIQAVHATATPVTYMAAFDYGEVIDKVPFEVITHITNTNVLTPTKRITHNWNSVNGYMTDILYPCKNSASIHDAVCVPNLTTIKPPCNVGDLVMARYRGTFKYFLAVVLRIDDTTVGVLYASSEVEDAVPYDHIFVVDPKYEKPVAFSMTAPEEEAKMTVILPESGEKDNVPPMAESISMASRLHASSMQQIAVLPRRFSLSKILSGPMMASDSSVHRHHPTGRISAQPRYFFRALFHKLKRFVYKPKE
ncbi:hypothetical protein SDRG_11362 [Saprolegnia diclina VS20]|uniref:Uncharacterized protein n=1 Tax=Saprolegnia diclina (strain VS20) TaxID=1156394 RepID=T0Q8D3_SAPDV|nr:hypothetical protein SDRG_11362 [Saprolegnia diclina VS20]EQC30881.1 hypothetical protein SDRG_11362 [Saprolegnia diclina VS20]|eukprot:XP_008615619.1 hypothetical protein SDRG_11362 [Saprolegnia diclina VS20]